MSCFLPIAGWLDPGFLGCWSSDIHETGPAVARESLTFQVLTGPLSARPPNDKALRALIGELSTCSETFRIWWATHNVRFHRTGVKRLRHPVAGDLTLTFEVMDLTADSDLQISAYTAEPGTPSHDALNFLASWAAPLGQAEAAQPTE